MLAGDSRFPECFGVTDRPNSGRSCRLAGTCPGCGQLNHAPIPQDLKVHSVGPCLAATLGYLAGSRRASNRGLEETTEDVFDVPIALVYDELRKLAAQKLAQEKPGQTLQAAALVHEAYLRLVDV